MNKATRVQRRQATGTSIKEQLFSWLAVAAVVGTIAAFVLYTNPVIALSF